MDLMLIYHPHRGMFRVERLLGERFISEGTYFETQKKADEAKEKSHGEQRLQEQRLHPKGRKGRGNQQ